MNYGNEESKEYFLITPYWRGFVKEAFISKTMCQLCSKSLFKVTKKRCHKNFSDAILRFRFSLFNHVFPWSDQCCLLICIWRNEYSMNIHQRHNQNVKHLRWSFLLFIYLFFNYLFIYFTISKKYNAAVTIVIVW